jgi:glc operon protein GlcG
VYDAPHSPEPKGSFEISLSVSGGYDKEKNMTAFARNAFIASLFFVCSFSASGQMPNPYGAPISLENAKKAAAPALAEGLKNNWTVVVAVVDPNGNLVYYEKMDNTQLGSAEFAVSKARSAACFKRPTKAFQDALAGGGVGVRVLRIEGAVPVEGGIPIVMDGKIVGAIGVSGDTSEHDSQCAKAGADSLK